MPNVTKRAPVEDLLTLLAEKLDITSREGSVHDLVLKWWDTGTVDAQLRRYGESRTQFWELRLAEHLDIAWQASERTEFLVPLESIVVFQTHHTLDEHEDIRWSREARESIRQWQSLDAEMTPRLPGLLLLGFSSQSDASRRVVKE